MTKPSHDAPVAYIREGALSPVLIGRESELRLLEEGAVRSPAVAIVEGEAGVGKTRLIEEFLRQEAAPRRRAVVARSLPLAQPFPLGVVLDAVRQIGDCIRATDLDPVAGAVAPHLPEIASLLPDPPDPLGDPGAERHRLFRGLGEVLRKSGRLIVVFEDLHWADATTLEFVHFLLRRMPSSLFLVLSLRPEEIPTSSLSFGAGLPPEVSEVRIQLEPLPVPDVGRLVGSILETEEVSDTFASYLHERTAGIPFAVEELVMLMRAQSDVVRKEGHWVRRSLDDIRVPSRVRDFILARLKTLSEAARSLVESASVFRTGQSGDVLERISQLHHNQAEGALCEAIAARLLLEEAPGRYAFRHPLAREAVEDVIPPPVRTSLHLRAANILQSNSTISAAEVAHHFKQAGQWRDWVRFAEAGADQASDVGDDVTAARLLAQALSTEGLDLADRVRIALKLGTAAKQGLAHDEALPLLRPLLEEEELEPECRGELRLRVAWLLYQRSGRVEECMAEVETAVTELEHEPGLASRAMSTLASPWACGLHMDEHLAWLDRASATVARCQDPVARMTVAVDRAALLAGFGRPDGWTAFEEIPRTGTYIEERRQLVRGYANIASFAVYLGHHERASRLLREGITLAREVAAHRERGFMEDATTLLRDFVMGQWEGMRARAERSIETWGDLSADVEAELVLGALDVAQGEHDRGVARLSSVSEAARSTGDYLADAFATARCSAVHLARGDPAGAWSILQHSLDTVRSKGIWSWAGDLSVPAVRALLAQDRLADAKALEAELSAGLTGLDAPLATAMVSFAQGLIAEVERALDSAFSLLGQAVSELDALPRPYEAASAREDWGRVGVALGNEAGVAELTEALIAFETLGCVLDFSRVKGELRRAGVGFGHRRGRKGYGEQLSPREEEILKLISAGLTSREVAATLFLSPRTVDSHVQHMLQKLGLSSRRELARARAQEFIP